MRALKTILGVALLCLFIGCGGESDVDKIKKDMDALNAKVGAINQKHKEMPARIEEMKKLDNEFSELEKRIGDLPADQQKDLRNSLQNVRNRIQRPE